MRGGQYVNALVAGVDMELEPYRAALLAIESHVLSHSGVPVSYIACRVEEVGVECIAYRVEEVGVEYIA